MCFFGKNTNPMDKNYEVNGEVTFNKFIAFKPYFKSAVPN
jgi:hypothetical protein